MRNRAIFGNEGSVASRRNNDERNGGWRSRCPECEGRVIAEGIEAFCEVCGLVVTIDAVECGPSLQSHAPENSNRVGEWAVETINELRTDKGLHTTFFLNTDGKGNPLSSETKDRMSWLRRQNKRFTMESKRHIRLNEGFRDIGMLGANLEIPKHVQVDTARYLKAAKKARLPGGRMGWESLAAGAMILACRQAGLNKTPEQIAVYAKTSCERLCAAARKIRMETRVEVPVVRERAVDRVVAALGEMVDIETGLELVRVADGLMEIADAEAIGPGTPRMTVAGAAVYAADRVTPGKSLTQAVVVEAVCETLPTTKCTLASYARELYRASDGRCPGDVSIRQASAD